MAALSTRVSPFGGNWSCCVGVQCTLYSILVYTTTASVQDSAGTRTAASRLVRRVGRGDHTAHVGVGRGEGGHCAPTDHLCTRTVQDIRRDTG